MAAQKLLRRERVIQLFGLLFLLSPFINFVVTVMTLNLYHKWSAPALFWVAKKISFSEWGLWLGDLILGSMMIKGRRASWLFVLILLSLFILYDGYYFLSDIRSGWFMPTLSLVLNIGMFALIYSQEFYQISHRPHFQEQPQSPPMPVARNLEAVSQKVNPSSSIVVDFEGVGPWAVLVSADQSRLKLRALHPPPERIEIRPIEVAFGSQFTFPIRFVEKSGQEYAFRFEREPTASEVQMMQQMILMNSKLSAA